MQRFGLIGFPLTHSFSPAYFQNKFQKEGLTDCRYEAFPLASIELLPELLAQHPDLCGFNVTIPYKEQIIPYLDEVDEAARQIGAVNCVIIQRNSDSSAKKYQLKGYNTDAPAFEHCLKEGWQLPDKALVFGTGGAAVAFPRLQWRASVQCLLFQDAVYQVSLVLSYHLFESAKIQEMPQKKLIHYIIF